MSRVIHTNQQISTLFMYQSCVVKVITFEDVYLLVMESKKLEVASSVELTVVVPVFNEVGTIRASSLKLLKVLRNVVATFEILIVDDGSTDGTPEVLKLLLEEIRELRAIRLHSNRGHMAAISVGLEHAKGQFIAIIDADLQDPPEALEEMYKILTSSSSTREKVLVVEAKRKDRSADTKFKRVSASIYYRLARLLTGIKMTSNVADYRMMSREVVDVLIQASGEEVYRVLIPYLGFPTKTIEIHRFQRASGKSKYNLGRMVNLALKSVFDYSITPIKIATRIALLVSLCSFSGIIWVFLTYIFVETAAGWSSIVALMLLLNGLLFGFISLVCFYLSKIYLSQKKRPRPFVSELLPFHDQPNF